MPIHIYLPVGSVVKNMPANAGDVGSVPELGRSPGEGNGKPLQYICLGNPMDREAWQATVHRVAKKLGTTLFLNDSLQGFSPGVPDSHGSWQGMLTE